MVRFIVSGEPRPQGSMTAVYNTRLKVARVRHVAAPALSFWRADVARSARAAGAEKWTGPIGLRVSFGIKPPIDRRHGYPKSPDLDKLVRAVMDALTGVCYVDDSQVVKLRAYKSWRVGTIIEVWRVEKQQASPEQQNLWQHTSARLDETEE